MKNGTLGKTKKLYESRYSCEAPGSDAPAELQARCGKCNGPLTGPVALIFTPESPYFNCCKKKHICSACWESLKEWLTQ